jgi:hypothetical protein
VWRGHCSSYISGSGMQAFQTSWQLASQHPLGPWKEYQPITSKYLWPSRDAVLLMTLVLMTFRGKSKRAQNQMGKVLHSRSGSPRDFTGHSCLALWLGSI